MKRFLLIFSIFLMSCTASQSVPGICSGTKDEIVEECKGYVGGKETPQLHLQVNNASLAILQAVQKAVEDKLTDVGCIPGMNGWECGASPLCTP